MSIGRKRWNLHDGPKGSLRRLRNQLAEDGCAESQVVLAKQLLEEKCELEVDKISNFKQALDWLICATEQAHPEARRMLKRCIRSGVIDEDSAAIVRAKSCLAASRQETVARKAARDLFASLSNGEQYITTAQLERRIREICNTTLRKQEEDSDEQDDDSPDCSRALSDGPCERPQLQAGDQPLGNGTLRGADHDEDYPDRCAPSGDIRNLTVDNLVSAAVDYCQGELPLVSYRLTLSDPPLNALDHIPLLHQAFLHPIVFLQVIYLKLLLYFGSFNFRLSNVEVCLVFAAYLSVNRESVSQLAPALLYYASFAAMVVTTFKMLKAKRQFVDFRKWSGLFLRYSDGGLRPDESEELFVRNNLGPFVQFFAALLVNLSLAPFVPAGLAPGAELGVVALALALLTLAAFGAEDNPFPDAVALLSFAVNAIAKYPAEEAGWAGADEEEAPLALGGGVEVRLGARGLAALAGAALVLGAAARGGRRGRAGGALAHGVCVAWLQLGAALAARGSAAGAARGALLAALWLLAAPLAGAASVCLPVAALLQGVPLSRGALALCAALCVALALALSCALAATDATKKFVTPLQLLIGLSTLVYFGNQLVVSIRDDGIPSSFIDLVTDEKSSIKNLLKNEFLTDYDENTYHISWEDYYNHCNNPTWSDYNVAVTQIKCSVLDGANVHWEGYVKDVNVIEVKNLWNSISVWMPAFVREYFKCYYGEEYSTLCCETEGLHSLKECEFVNNVARQSGKTCHLNNLNEYTYEVKLTMEAGGGLLKRHAVLSVIFDHYFTNITRLLRTNDKVKFKGILLNENGHYVIGTKDLSIKAYEISCLECKETIGTLSAKAPSSTKISELISTLIDDCVVSTKYILNFILNPVVVFK